MFPYWCVIIMQEAEAETTPVPGTCVIELSQDEVDAGAEFSIVAKVVLSPPLDLRGDMLIIEDEQGNEVGSAEFTEFDDETYVNETASLMLRAPLAVGEATWTVVLPRYIDEGDDAVSHAELRTPFTFTVNAHKMRLVVWHLPSAIVAGEAAKLMVGLKCSNECPLEGTEVAIFDHDGQRAGSAALGADHWPGGSLHFAEITFTAPEETGLHHWEARTEESRTGVAHADASLRFGVTTVPPPECTVTVTAFDAEQRTPVRNARIVIHPYRVTTDERGVAELKLPKGDYRMFVSAYKYEPTDRSIAVSGDLATTAELFKEPPEDLAAPYKM
jgi:hypothetical protein